MGSVSIKTVLLGIGYLKLNLRANLAINKTLDENKSKLDNIVSKQLFTAPREIYAPKEMMLDNCYEFKSKSLMKKLYELIGSPNPQFTYRFIGNGVSEYNMVVFPIKTMTPFEG